MTIQNFDNFVFENALNKISKDIVHKFDDLGLSLSHLSDEEAFSFLNATLMHDGDVNKVKPSDLNEQFEHDINESSAGEILDVMGKVGEVLGLTISIEFLVMKIAKKLGKSIDPGVVSKKIHTLYHWIYNLTGWQSALVKRTFEFAAKALGIKKKGQHLAGRVCLVIVLCVLLICSLMVFPAIGAGGFAMFVAAIASLAKIKEIYEVCVEIWEIVKAPTEAEIKKYDDFFTVVSHLGNHFKEKVFTVAK